MPTNTSLTNLWLWLLTGRSGGFLTPALNSHVAYNTDPDPTITEVRRVMGVDDRRSDHAVLGLLASMQAMRGCVDLPQENSSIHHPETTVPTFSKVFGAEVIAMGSRSGPSICYRAVRYPFPIDWRLKVAGGKFALTNDQGERWDVDSRWDGNDAYPVWPSELNFYFGLRYAAAPEGSTVRLVIPPGSFPFSHLARQLQDSAACRKVIADAGLGDSFAQAQAFTQVGLAANALALAAWRRTSGVSATGVECVIAGEDDVTYEPGNSGNWFLSPPTPDSI